ncbi:G5 domain [Syntrophomonas zehnderi OL-4]|uniref:G5 domain n=1 Tax=Syntrophomonas zehnderi OL-4 TaxID=690567 RepID=A0A0E4GAP3_9FIRM|nr:peptidoglycan binding domain-containing protein [Syntrophomonas zehnderi]CFX17171.1 G5 domain [Syntrophomonas zehnderi OL-4]
MTDVNKIIIKVISLGLLAACLSIMLVSMALAKRDAAIYPSNLKIGDIAVANLNQDEAGAKIRAEMDRKWDSQLKIIIDKQNSVVSIPITELGITYDVDASLQKADEYLHTGSLLQHTLIRGESIDIAPVMKINNKVLFDQKLTDIMDKANKPAVDARVLYIKGYLEYVVHVDGYIVKRDESLAHIKRAIAQGYLGPIALKLQDVYPKVKTEDIKDIKSLIGVGTGSLNEFIVREPILGQTISRINGTIVMNEDDFSLKTALADHESKDLEQSCQQVALIISNTLANACRSANLHVVNTEPGEVEFINNTGNPLMLNIAVEGSNLLVRIYGLQTEKGKEMLLIKEQTIISPQIEVKIDKKLKPGDKIVEKGQEGQKISTFRVVRVNGQEIEKKLLTEEIHPPRNTVITVAPGTTIK